MQSWAIYDLILLVHTLADDLKPTKPIHKVAIVKAVVFVSFWQGLLISILQTAGVIKVGKHLLGCPAQRSSADPDTSSPQRRTQRGRRTTSRA